MRFGHGQIIGEIKHVLKKDVFSLKSYQSHISAKDLKTREMALNLGKISKIGAEINVKCTSGTGQLLKISAHEFQEKILGNNLVTKAIKETIHNKLIQYVDKTGSRY